MKQEPLTNDKAQSNVELSFPAKWASVWRLFSKVCLLCVMALTSAQAAADESFVAGTVDSLLTANRSKPVRPPGLDPGAKIITSDNAPTGGTHVVTPGVPAFGVNLDGVVNIASSTFGAYCTGSLISDRHVLTAAHCDVTVGDGVGFDTTQGLVYFRVSDVVNHPLYSDSTLVDDVAVLTLERVAPVFAPRYELYTKTDEVGKTLVTAGFGTSGHGSGGAEFDDSRKRAGLNRYDAIGEDADLLFGHSGSKVGSELVYDFDDGTSAHDAFGSVSVLLADLGFGTDEVNASFGDSGGPSFIDDGGVFKVAGVVSRGGDTAVDVTPGVDASWGEINRDARVSTYAPFIQGLVAAPVSAPPPAPVSTGVVYGASAQASSFIDISATGSALALGDDNFVDVPIGFDFSFFGDNYNSLFVSSNGHLTFDDGSVAFQNENVLITSSPVADDLPMIAPFWDDFDPDSGGSVLHQTIGSPGARQFIVQWQDVLFFDSLTLDEKATFQVVLDEATGDIAFNYLDVENDRALEGALASIGIRNQGGHLTGDALLWSYRDAVLSNGDSILITVVPEPTGFTLGALGFALLVGIVLRRRARKFTATSLADH